MSKFITIAIMFLACNTDSQSSKHPVDYQLLGKPRTYTVIGMTEARDSSVMLLMHRYETSEKKMEKREHELFVKDLSYLRVRKKRNVGKGILIGGAVGFFMGYALVGFGDDSGSGVSPSSKELGVALGSITGLGGALIGGFTAKSYVKIPLNGKQEVYEKRKDELLPYLIK